METVSIAESTTCGHVMAKFGSISGASEYFRGGINAYHIDQKISLLGINKKHAELYNCISPIVANEMAKGISKLFKTDVGIGITGYIEPYPILKISEPFVHCAFYYKKTKVYENFIIRNDKNLPRIEFQIYIADLIYQKYHGTLTP